MTHKIKILITNIGDNKYGRGLCSSNNKSEEALHNIRSEQIDCLRKYLTKNYDFILLQEVCAETYFYDIGPVVDNYTYTTYATPHRPNRYYFDEGYKFNIIFSYNGTSTFQKKIIEADIVKNCIIEDPYIYYPNNEDAMHYHKALEEDPYNKEILPDIGYRSSKDNNLIVRYNWVNNNYIYPNEPSKCVFGNSQFGLYAVGVYKLMIVNVHMNSVAKIKSGYDEELTYLLEKIREFAMLHRVVHIIIAGDLNIFCHTGGHSLCNSERLTSILGSRHNYNVLLAKNLGVLYSPNISIESPYRIYPPCVGTTSIYDPNPNHPALELNFVLSDKAIERYPIDLRLELKDMGININYLHSTHQLTPGNEHKEYVDIHRKDNTTFTRRIPEQYNSGIQRNYRSDYFDARRGAPLGYGRGTSSFRSDYFDAGRGAPLGYGRGTSSFRSDYFDTRIGASPGYAREASSSKLDYPDTRRGAPPGFDRETSNSISDYYDTRRGAPPGFARQTSSSKLDYSDTRRGAPPGFARRASSLRTEILDIPHRSRQDQSVDFFDLSDEDVYELLGLITDEDPHNLDVDDQERGSSEATLIPQIPVWIPSDHERLKTRNPSVEPKTNIRKPISYGRGYRNEIQQDNLPTYGRSEPVRQPQATNSKSQIKSPTSRAKSPKTRATSPKSQITSPKSQITNLKAQATSPKSKATSPETRETRSKTISALHQKEISDISQQENNASEEEFKLVDRRRKSKIKSKSKTQKNTSRGRR